MSGSVQPLGEICNKRYRSMLTTDSSPLLTGNMPKSKLPIL
ncbi:hypothetical protein [Sporisorium scitamineum]|uniref:Uncharacterized protein n=1 Tax=Sporisorium scitamineum TaxID=49012 RepID=A0A0F7RWW2_9BASI|nr:hypothetical protein [Sporisorium scitamineum]